MGKLVIKGDFDFENYISSRIIDYEVCKIPLFHGTTRYALEVQIKDNFVTLGGEITSQANFTDDELALCVKIAVGAAVYVLGSVVFRLEAFLYLKNLLLERFKKSK